MRARILSSVDPQLVQRFYILAYLLFILKYLCQPSLLVPWPGYIDVAVSSLFIAMVLIKIALQHFTAPQILGFIAVSVLCVYSSVNAHYSSPMLSLLLVMALQDVDLRDVLRAGYRFKAVIILIHVICYIALIIVSPDSVVYLYRGGVARHFFLLGHPNLFTTLVVWTCLEYIYVNYDRIRAIHYAAILLVNIVIYRFTDSRSGFYTLIIVVVFAFFDKLNFRPMRTVANALAKYGFGVLSVLSIALTVVYTPEISGRARVLWLKLNELLTGRLVFGAYAYHDFGFTWLGRALTFPEKVLYNSHWFDDVIFDNSYQWFVVVYGGIFLVIIALAFFFNAKRMTVIEKIIISAFSIFALMENYTVNVAVCFPLLLIGKCIFSQRREDEETIKITGEETVPLWKRKSA